MRVLLTLGKHPKTLAAARSIGKSGRMVFTTDDTKFPLTKFSRYCSGHFHTNSPSANPQSFFEDICTIVRDNAIDLVIPMDEPELDILVEHDAQTTLGAKVATTSANSYSIARDKHKTIRHAESLGIGVPKTRLVSSYAQLVDAVEDVGFPAVIKPCMSSGSRGFLVLENRESVARALPVIERHKRLIAQEYIPSNCSLGVSLLMKNGERIAEFTHKRVLEFPFSGGPSIVRISARDEVSEGYATRLLEALRWHGVAMVEFRIDTRTNQPMLMEINPRFWGSLPLAIACGVDFPKMLCELYESGETTVVESYRLGVKCSNFLPLGAAAVVSAGRMRKSLRILKEIVNSNCHDVESFQDPLPTLGACLSMLAALSSDEMVDMVFRRTA
jgi:predicted ATP-grasp superfamily ATP-dependent carboligase